MELVQELFVTASVALLLSFLVAKLVSIGMAGDVGRELGFKAGKIVDGEIVAEEMKFEERLRVQGLESERRVEFVGEAVKKVDEYEGRGSVRIYEGVGESRGSEEFVDERCELPKGKESEVVELPEKSSEGKYGEEETVTEEGGESGLEGVNADNLDSLVEEEKFDDKEADEINVDKVVVAQSEEVGVLRCEAKGGDAEREGLSIDEDDWEGIERSELEKDFAAAAKFVGSGKKDGKLSSVGSDVQMQLYGFQKVAMEGPCREPQPMALMVSARANWNAWQRLGNMSPEVAMEQYISLLSDRVPGWMEASSAGDDKRDTLETDIPTPDPDSSMSLHHQSNSTNERKPELKSGTEGGNPTGGSNSVDRDKE